MKTLIYAVSMLMMAAVAAATIIHVPSQYPTIQAGINAASPGDTVLVAPGIYYENVHMAEGVNLIGSGMDSTIIDGGGLADVVSAVQINNAYIEAFTVRNSQQGGSSPGNIGIFFNPQSSTGVKIARYCRVHHCGHGIDIWNDFGGVAYIEHNIISDNIYDGFDPYLGTTYLTNNTIADNGRDGYHDWAGGGQVFIRNNIFASNGRYGIFKHRDTPVFISYNDVWNNVQGAYYEGYSGSPNPFIPNPGTGEIAANPLFLEPPIDYHLTWANFPTPDSTKSPCIDAGDPAWPPDPDSTCVDMGALYFDQSGREVTITLTPYGAPIQVLQSGGTFYFNLYLDYILSPSSNFDCWIMLQHPDSSWSGPVFGPMTMHPQAHGTFFDLDTSYTVAAGLDTGTYVFEGRIGYCPHDIWDSHCFTFDIIADTTGVNPNQGEVTPTQFALYQNYPNPFNPTTNITYSLPISGFATLNVYNTTGQHVITLASGWHQPGIYSTTFNGANLSSGIYFCRMEAGNCMQVRKLLLLK
jgi:hypothetical protein